MFNTITVFGEDASEPSISDSNYIYEENKKTPDVCDNDASASGLNDTDNVNANNVITDNQEDLDKNDINKEEKHYGWYFNKQHNGWYYYNQQGEKMTGWQQVHGAWYYLDAENEDYPGLMLADCSATIGGSTYFFDKDGVMLNGWVLRPEGWYYTNSSGAMMTGWQQVYEAWYYLDAENENYPGLMLTDCSAFIGGSIYFFDKDGVMPIGWVLRPEGWYYTNGSGAMLTGWQQIYGEWYYLDARNEDYPGLMLADCEKNLGGSTYFFNKDGIMLSGWVLRPEGWYYTNRNGVKLTGWQQVSDFWYYLDAGNEDYPGLMLADCDRVIGNNPYHFEASGAMRVGWRVENGNWYYYDKYSGQLVSGWKLVSGKWYYMNPDNENKMVSGGWNKIGNQWYLFNNDGAMCTGWILKYGLWYYLGEDGAARTGWKVIGGNWYYFYTANDPHGGVECAMARNVSIDGWKLTDSGAMVSSTEMKMLAKAQSYASNTKYLILVDRSACRVGIYTGKAENWKQSKFWSCSPGKPSTPTVSGTFTVQGKGYYFDSGRARCFYYTQFKGNYLFHSVLYAQTSRPSKIIDGRLGMQLSHGCVRLDVNNAKWIYDNVPRGTKVVIY